MNIMEYRKPTCSSYSIFEYTTRHGEPKWIEDINGSRADARKFCRDIRKANPSLKVVCERWTPHTHIYW